MNIETLNYIYNLLSTKVDKTRNIKQYTYKTLIEAENTVDETKIEKANEDHQFALKKYNEALDAFNDFKNKNWN